jgi:hypothetical protein
MDDNLKPAVDPGNTWDAMQWYEVKNSVVDLMKSLNMQLPAAAM